MSDIIGLGYGSSHDWKIQIKQIYYDNFYNENSYTMFVCVKCSEIFGYFHNRISDIFEAMKQQNIIDKCPKKNTVYVVFVDGADQIEGIFYSKEKAIKCKEDSIHSCRIEEHEVIN